MLNLYYCLIQPYITYALEVWYCASDYVRNIVCVLQKRCARCIHNLPYNSHTRDFFSRSNILPVDCLHKRNVLLYMYKTINGHLEEELRNLLIRNRDIHSISTRNRNNFVLPRYNRSISQNCILFKGVELLSLIHI